MPLCCPSFPEFPGFSCRTEATLAGNDARLPLALDQSPYAAREVEVRSPDGPGAGRA